MSTATPVIMVVEDDALIMMGYEMAIEDAGCRHVTATTLQEGMDVVTPEIDAAILDIRLGEDRVFELAYALIETGIPFLFCSGSATDMPAGVLSQVPMIEKPARAEDVVARAVGIIRERLART